MEKTYTEIEEMITDYLKKYEGEKTTYIKGVGVSFDRTLVWAFIYDHLAEIGGWDQSSTLYHLNADVEGIIFGRLMGNLRNIYNDKSEGEYFYEQDQMGSASYHLRALSVCDFASWSRNLLLMEVQRKNKLGHFNQVQREFEVFQGLLKNFSY
jgi:hypothetical protein